MFLRLFSKISIIAAFAMLVFVPSVHTGKNIEWNKATQEIFKVGTYTIQTGSSHTLGLGLDVLTKGSSILGPAVMACKTNCDKITYQGTGVNANIIFDTLKNGVEQGKTYEVVFTGLHLSSKEIIEGKIKFVVKTNPCFKFNTVKSCTLAQDCQWNGAHCMDVKEENKNKAPIKRGFSKEEETAAAQKAQAAALEADANSKLNNLGNVSIQIVLGTVIRAILGIVGSIALAMFVYGGFTVMTAAGNSERTKKGTEILIWSALGVVVILASYALVDLVFDVFR